MQELRPELLEARLKDYRIGPLMCARLKAVNARRIRLLKQRTGRSLKDIFRFLFYLYQAHPERFPSGEIPRRPVILKVRASRAMHALLKDEAWLRKKSSSYIFNDLVEGLFRCLRRNEIESVFRELRDKALLVFKEGR